MNEYTSESGKKRFQIKRTGRKSQWGKFFSHSYLYYTFGLLKMAYNAFGGSNCLWQRKKVHTHHFTQQNGTNRILVGW